MRLYSADMLDDMQAPWLLKEWHGDGLLTGEQHRQLQEEITSEWRTTNPFLRVALFLFAVAIVALVEGLFFLLFAGPNTETTFTVLLLLSSVACYAGAEYAVRELRLYHFGIEEALVVCSIAFLFFALQLRYMHFLAGSDLGELFIVAPCAGFSLWTWYRFGYWYTFVAAMVFIAVAASCLTALPSAQHGLAALLYAGGLAGVVAAARHRQQYDPLQKAYAVAEAWLWAGMYLSLNLVLYGFLSQRFRGFGLHGQEPSTAFYWLTWVLIWCLPPVLLLHGIRRKERLLLGLGAALLIVTFVCNKPYLHWQRHPWDPMLLGAVLMGVAWGVQRWLASGADGIRNGFTAARKAGKQHAWLTAGTSAFSLVAPNAAMHHAPTQGPLGEGGASGGGGAGGTF